MLRGCSVFWDDEHGVVLSAELILITTILVIGLVSGLTCLQQAVVSEFHDIGRAITALNQSYAFSSFLGCPKWWGRASFTAGSRFTDVADGCVGGNCVGGALVGGDLYGMPGYYGGPMVAPPAVVTPPSVVVPTPAPEVVPSPAPTIVPTPEVMPIPGPCPPILREPLPAAPPAVLPPCNSCPPASTVVPVPQEIPQGPAPVFLPQV
jgi:Flp pilus assembly pilin Flp